MILIYNMSFYLGITNEEISKTLLLTLTTNNGFN